ncbi:MAG TPA: hypothetical protein VHA71_10080 [Rhodanobacteraceae bacterium]|nr:hypothetical protein [Rhodanobacteraceae bacterium]
MVADFYQGLDLPPDWADKPTDLGVGLAHQRLMSVMVALDAEEQPLAACWQIDGNEEQFARAASGDGTEYDVLAGLDDDLASESRRLGAEDLLDTLLWDPAELRPDQGEYVREVQFVRGTPHYQSMMGWNEATRTIVAEAPGLLLMRREVQDGLALSVPGYAQALRGIEMRGDARFYVIKIRAPGEVPRAQDWKDLSTIRVMAFCWITLVACIVAAACVVHFGK